MEILFPELLYSIIVLNKRLRYSYLNIIMLTFTDNFENDKELILRDHLALERTKLANERTLFAYIRMALYLLTVWIGIFQIESISRLDGLAWGCIIAGIFLFFLGFVRFEQMRKHLKQYTKTCRDTENESSRKK